MTLYFILVVGGTSKKHGRAIWVVSMEKGAKKSHDLGKASKKEEKKLYLAQLMRTPRGLNVRILWGWGSGSQSLK